MAQSIPTQIADLNQTQTEIFDFGYALNLATGDIGFWCELAALAHDEFEVAIEKLHDALAELDADRLFQTAHALKNQVGNFGAHRAHKAAQNVEYLGREGNLAEIDDPLGHLIDEVRRLDTALTNLIHENSGVGAEMVL